MAEAQHPPPPGRAFCVYHSIPLAKPAADMDWWTREVCSTQLMPTADEPSLLALVRDLAPPDAKRRPPPPPPAVADVELLRRALGQPGVAEESRETIDPPIHALLDADRAADRVLRLYAEFQALAPELAPPLPPAARARDVHWLLAEPAWVEALRPVKGALAARAAPALASAFFALSKAILKCRYLHAHRSDALVNAAAAEPARALDGARGEVHRLVGALGALEHALGLELLAPATYALDPRPLVARLVAEGLSAPGAVARAAGGEPWTGGLAGQPAGRVEAAIVQSMRDAVRAAAAARAATHPTAARLGVAHDAASARSLGLLSRLALALDAYARLTSREAAGQRVALAYAALHAALAGALPIPVGLAPELLPWLVGAPPWRRTLDDLQRGGGGAEAGGAAAAELAAALAQHAAAEAALADDALDAHLADLAASGQPTARLRDALREQARAAVAELGALAPGLAGGEDGLKALGALRAKDLVGWLAADAAPPWDAMPARPGGEPRAFPSVLGRWQEGVWAAICAKRGASADDALALARIGLLGLTLDSLAQLAARRAERKQGGGGGGAAGAQPAEAQPGVAQRGKRARGDDEATMARPAPRAEAATNGRGAPGFAG
jgi:hypothetical protein